MLCDRGGEPLGLLGVAFSRQSSRDRRYRTRWLFSRRYARCALLAAEVIADAVLLATLYLPASSWVLIPASRSAIMAAFRWAACISATLAPYSTLRLLIAGLSFALGAPSVAFRVAEPILASTASTSAASCRAFPAGIMLECALSLRHGVNALALLRGTC